MWLPGTRMKSPCFTLSIAVAMISTPGNCCATGVGLMSKSPAAVEPITTILPANSSFGRLRSDDSMSKYTSLKLS